METTRIRSSRISAIACVALLAATVAAPIAMLAAFPWVTRAQIAKVIGVAPVEAQPLAFEGETITLEEADATVATLETDADDANDALDEFEVEFTPICDQNPLANVPVAVLTYDTERGTLPFDVVESVRPYVGEPNH